MHHPTDKIAHTTGFGTPVVEHWMEREIAHWVHQEGSTHRTMDGHYTTELHLNSDHVRNILHQFQDWWVQGSNPSCGFQ